MSGYSLAKMSLAALTLKMVPRPRQFQETTIIIYYCVGVVLPFLFAEFFHYFLFVSQGMSPLAIAFLVPFL